MKTVLPKIICLCLITFAATSCTKDNKTGSQNNEPDRINGNCSYKITIEEETTHPNQFGKDNLIFSSASGPEGKAGFMLAVGQTKANGQIYPAFELGCEPDMPFNAHTKVGTTYQAKSSLAIALNLPDLAEYSYHMDYNATPREGTITVTVLENSENRIRFGISGTTMKKEGGVENWTNLKLVPVRAELTIDRNYYNEMTSNGVFTSVANCNCQQ